VLDAFSIEVLARADEAAEQIREYLADLAEVRRRAPREDLISALVTNTDAGLRLTEDEVVTMAALLFAAGFETTTHLLCNGLVALLTNPDQADALRADADAHTAVEELLRFDSSVQLTGRTALADTEVAGAPIVKGDRVICYLGAANRDPQRYHDPDRLELTRRQGAPLSFGGGIHHCLGASLARLESQLAFPALLTRYPDLQLADGAQRRDSLTLRGYLNLPVTC
jgi:cytochrome P450